MAPCTSSAREEWQQKRRASLTNVAVAAAPLGTSHRLAARTLRRSSSHPSRPSPSARPEQEGTRTRSSRLRRDHRHLLNERRKCTERYICTSADMTLRSAAQRLHPAFKLRRSGRSRGWAPASAPSPPPTGSCEPRNPGSGPCRLCRPRSTASPGEQSTARSQPNRASSCSCP
jgi:hypothetical protein